ncbi:hypothetical protein G7Z17_g3958 [Cylindrodendrum hubeiense]|uniref:O-methyltransferase domain-containing protein n=1 Tax=Cylindrodendrum hubeiense TaxID=595255 RepID=A0A9P5LJE0_9HYPO|nr:hypothetical protein G7Z17_g3958 [Cylindrodendrum hubeiense]
MAQPTSSPESMTAAANGLFSQQLSVAVENIVSNPSSLDGLDGERSKLIELSEALLKAIKPVDPVMDAMTTFVQFTAIRLFVGWKVFDKIPSTSSISFSDLATQIGADVSLIARLASILTATGVLKRVDNDQVAHTSSSAAFVTGSPMTAIVKMGTLLAMPAYFNEYGLKEPIGRYDTIYAYGAGDPKLTVWEHTNMYPERKANFMISMMAMASKTPTTGSYDFSWVLDQAHESPERALVVDVGGGKGHALQAICEATVGLPMNRCVLEDLQAIIDDAKATATGDLTEAQYVSMDFHSEQPVKGACIYYIRRCLHDYGDTDCVEILEQLQKAMAKDSRVLIVENVLGDPPSALSVANDIIMATIGGKERSLETFKDITGRAGLQIVKLHRSVGSDFAVIECQKA